MISEYNSQMDKFNALKMLIASIDTGNFTNAAERLGSSPSTVSKAISRLEQELGVRLLQRTTRNIQPTEACLEYLLTVRPLFEQLSVSEERLSSAREQPQGTLRINLPVAYGRQVILPMIPAFNQRYPKISLDITWDDDFNDLVGEGIDVAIRSGRLQDSRLVFTKLSPMDFVTCCSPSYLQTHGIPETREALMSHHWLLFRFQHTGRLMPIYLDAENHDDIWTPENSTVANDAEALAEFAAQGMGLVQLPHFVVYKWVKEGRLSIISPPIRSTRFSVYIYYLNKTYLPQKVRIFIDHVKAELSLMNETAQTTWLDNS
jgi:DNA-binding transcriptional LysR family regulator